MTGEQIYDNFTNGYTTTLDCAAAEVGTLAGHYRDIVAGLKRAQDRMMAHWTGGAALSAWGATTELADAIGVSAERLDTYGTAHAKQSAAFESASLRVVPIPPEPGAFNPFDGIAEVFRTGDLGAYAAKENEHKAAVEAHHAASANNAKVMADYETATSGHTIPDNYPHVPSSGIELGKPAGGGKETEGGGKETEGGGQHEGGGSQDGGGQDGGGQQAGGSGGGVTPVSGARGDGSPGGYGPGGGDTGTKAPDGRDDLGDPPPGRDPGITDPSKAPPGPFGPPIHHLPPPGLPPVCDPPGPPLTGTPPAGPGGSGGPGDAGGPGTQAARAAGGGRTGRLDGSDLTGGGGGLPWSAGPGGDAAGDNSRGGPGQSGRSVGVGVGLPGAAGGGRSGLPTGPRGAGGTGGFGGVPLSGRQEEDEEHTRPDYLIEPDPDELFGSDERVSSPVIGETWAPE